MVSKHTIPAVVLLGVLASTPAFAQDRDRRNRGDDRRGGRSEQQRDGRDGRDGPRAVPRTYDRSYRYDSRRDSGGRRDQVRRDYEIRRDQTRRYYDSRPTVRPYYQDRGRGYGYQDRGRYGYGYQDRGRYGNGYRYGYGYRSRIIRPRIVTVIPYRPYVYRPRFGFSLYYGAGGSYPYGYTPRGYYDPLPGHYYGGLRITNAPRDAQVFADGYYVGIVDDFDGVFQHVNLEAGEHQIEIRGDGYEPIAFDVVVQPGQTVTYRADVY